MNELQAPEATMSGQAARIPAALKAQPGQMTAKIQITRAATGKVEEYQLAFTPLPADDQPKEA
ncbi:MAG TPA: hypothetical protein PLN91_03015 [Rhodanobacteraceae bacterium]|nr:hypothetical protein [Rhodanobacteraceae bacterium]